MISLIKGAAKLVLPKAAWNHIRNRWWRYVRPVTVDYCPIVLPWFAFVREDTPTAQLHRLALSFHWNNQWSFVTAVSVIVAAMLWPFRLGWDSVRVMWKHGKETISHYQIGYMMQLYGIMRHAIICNTPPCTTIAIGLLTKRTRTALRRTYIPNRCPSCIRH